MIDAAARHLNRHGVRDNTLRDLAAELQLTRAALYYYVEDREDLVFQAYRRSCELLAKALGDAITEGGAALDIVGGFVAKALAPGQPELASLTELGLLRPDDHATVLALYEGVVARLAGVLEAGVRNGELRPLDPDIVARTVISMIHGLPQVLSYSFLEAPPTAGDYAALLQDVLIHGWMTDRGRLIAPVQVELSPYRTRQVSAFDREALAAARREQVMVVASQLFNRKGIDATSLDEIARELRATKRTLYQYVGDKQALVSACFKRGNDIGEAIHQQALAANPGPDRVVEAIVASLQGAGRMWLYDDIAPLRLNLGLEALSPHDQQAVIDYALKLGENWQGHFKRMQARGEARALDLDLFLPMLPTAAAWLSKGLVKAEGARRVEIAAQVVDVHRLGLKPL
ncbi:TetR/AcrR family transcriptional regulator [Phenylobacterium sp.]|uniref:TetR/AcrR family transcriptional regulator n=1 Tax=Phenylobacterium sp. TaxID=1871053 RepID=UPI0035B0B044